MIKNNPFKINVLMYMYGYYDTVTVLLT